MAIIQNDNVVDYLIAQEHICKECATQEEEEEATLDAIITENDRGIEDRYFCDRCKEEM